MIQNGENLLSQNARLYLKNLCRVLSGLLILILSTCLLFSLLSYHSTDPSLNTASTFPTKNLFGIIGSSFADIFLQFFGITAFTIVHTTYLTSRWLINPKALNYRLKHVLLYTVISIIPTTLTLSYISNSVGFLAHFPTHSGLGGTIGICILSEISNLIQNLGISSYMHIIVFTLALIATLVTNYFAYNLTQQSIAKFETFIAKCYDHILTLTLRILGRKNVHKRDIAKLQSTHTLTPNKEQEKEAETEQMSHPSREKSAPQRPRQSIIINTIKKLFAHKSRTNTALAATSKTNISISDKDKAKSTNTSHQRETSIQRERQPKPKTTYQLPSVDLLNKMKNAGFENSNTESNIQKARMLESILREYKLNGKITNIKTGPVITLFEMEPGPGIRTSDIKNLSEDIARKIEAISIRIAVIQGTNKIGIELPNLHRQMVSLRTQFESDDFKHSEYKLPISLGSDTNGHPVFVDLASMPHLLIAGTTGSGKSVGVNGMILSLLYKYTPDECKFIMIDPKMVEFSVYNDIPHLLIPVVIDPAKAVAALKWAVLEMEDRYQNMHILGSKNIESYNEKARNNPDLKITRNVQTGFDPQTGDAIIDEKEIAVKPYPYIVIVVDEMADLMLQAKKEVETAIARLAAKARAAGIHLIISTQRPSVDVITGTIKSNFPNRISYHVASGQDSRTILNEYGAELLLGKGDMLYMATGGNTVRIHGAFVSEQEIENVVKHIKSQSKPNYISNITIEDEAPAKNKMSSIDRAMLKEAQGEDLYQQAIEIILSSKRPSISFLQRQLGIGYNKSANLIERMERDGILSAPDSTGKRMIIGKK